MGRAAGGPTGRFLLEAEGPYSLSASTRFLEGFAPASYVGEGADRLRLAFVADGLDRGERVAGALARDEGDAGGGGGLVETYGEAAPEAVRGQLERILSLDADGGGFPGVGERDPVVGRLQQRYPGLRPVLFWSPYEAAAWAIVGNRIRIAQAARVKARMAGELGEEVGVAGAREWESAWVQLGAVAVSTLAFASYPVSAFVRRLRVGAPEHRATQPELPARRFARVLTFTGLGALLGFFVYFGFLAFTAASTVGPVVAGRPVLWLVLQALAVAASVSTVLIAASWRSSIKTATGVERTRTAILLAGGAVFVAWTAYWGLLSP